MLSTRPSPPPVMDTAEMTPQQQETEALIYLVDKPLTYVYYDFPWGVADTQLMHETGPDDWQRDVLETIEADLHNPATPAVRIAVSSGHGVGKGALTAWLINWFMRTRVDPQIVVTANTGVQLRTKTWREVAKWNGLSRTANNFVCNQERMYHKARPTTYQATPIPWDANQAEAFAGTHERAGHVLLIFDEASAIDDRIWEAAEGALTTYNAIWCVFGNMTRTTGRFVECFPGGRFAHLWHSFQIDGRCAKATNKPLLEQWIRDYGEDSDFVRVRVKGQKPRASSKQLISDETVRLAQSRAPMPWHGFARILGVDVAREGDDRTVFIDRQGPHIHSITVRRNLKTFETSHLVMDMMRETRYDAVFIDAHTFGIAVIDDLEKLSYPVTAVYGSAPPVRQDAQERYYNRRAEMWGTMNTWLETRGTLPEEREVRHAQELAAELQGPEYTWRLKNGHDVIILEPKEAMAARGLASPDLADALALTFAEPVLTDQQRSMGGRQHFAQGAMGEHTGQGMTRQAVGAL